MNHSASLCLLIGGLRSFIVKVITEMCVFIVVVVDLVLVVGVLNDTLCFSSKIYLSLLSLLARLMLLLQSGILRPIFSLGLTC